jgi:mono/diheme cytochrome c family protein
MNKEVGYILRGFLLMLVILAGLGFVHLLTSSERQQQVEETPRVYITNTDNAGKPSFYNARGKWLFDQNCGTCHKPGWTDEMFRLPYIEDRVKDKQLLRGWIRNSDSVLKSGNLYFNDLYEKWNKTPMPAFPQLNDGDIDEILEYLWRHRK